MFALAFEDRYRVLLVRFSGIHVPEDISELEWAATEIVAWDGPMHGLLLDYTSVEAVAVLRATTLRSSTLGLTRTTTPIGPRNASRDRHGPSPRLPSIKLTPPPERPPGSPSIARTAQTPSALPSTCAQARGPALP